MASHDSRRDRVAEGLLPIVRIVGEDVRWPMQERLDAYGVPGVGVAVIENGELAWADGFGVKQAGTHDPVDAHTMFSGASISKPLTALVALILVDRGLLHLDRNVNETLRSWQLPENEFTKDNPVTLRWLLCHKAGTTVHGFGGIPAGGPLPTMIDVLEGRKPAWTKPVRVDKAPGGTVRYSGGGTTIVQVMIEDVTGKKFEDVAQELIFDPLGLKDSTFAMPLPKRFHANAAAGFENGKVLEDRFVVVPQLAAGGVWCSPSDYARFMIACRNAWLGKPGAILSHETARAMMTLQGPGDFGLGWSILGEGRERRFEHGGSNDGYQCETTCYLESGKGAVVMTNADSGIVFYWEVLNAIADAHEWPGFLLEPKQPQKLTPDIHARMVGDYRIVSGVELPSLRIWSEGDKLRSEIPGMRGGPNDMQMDEQGRFFNRRGPFETHVKYGPDGRAQELTVMQARTTEILRAVRAS